MRTNIQKLAFRLEDASGTAAISILRALAATRNPDVIPVVANTPGLVGLVVSFLAVPDFAA